MATGTFTKKFLHGSVQLLYNGLAVAGLAQEVGDHTSLVAKALSWAVLASWGGPQHQAT